MFVGIRHASCTSQQQLYYAERANEPALGKAGDARVNISWDPVFNARNNDRHVDGLSARAAGSPVNHLGILASFDHLYNANSTHYQTNQGAFGAGYYTPFSPDKHWLFEIYGGYAFGKTSANNYYDSVNHFRASVVATYNGFFLQPAFGYKGENFSLVFGIKANQRIYHDIRLHENSYDTLYHGMYFFHEPYFDATYGFKSYRFNLQALWSQQVGGPHGHYIDGTGGFEVFPQNLTLSLGVSIFITKGMFRFKKE